MSKLPPSFLDPIIETHILAALLFTPKKDCFCNKGHQKTVVCRECMDVFSTVSALGCSGLIDRRGRDYRKKRRVGEGAGVKAKPRGWRESEKERSSSRILELDELEDLPVPLLPGPPHTPIFQRRKPRPRKQEATCSSALVIGRVQSSRRVS
ncbi:hypothetical protein HJG60_011167 [Phyllostomus discolor]|uniref:Uncharacterized protein n=1 Tax=Phyllostomus discolor TaxID=89673 RepID=A0A834A787_9CHIR|nr:hypothetical protein HJG60_011167 [Phyllostomus discolor]